MSKQGFITLRILEILERFISIFKGNTRSSKYRKNAFLLILYQFLSVIISLWLITITLDYLGVQEYGVWITLTTIISWFTFFDLGLGHGLRNKYAEAAAKNDLLDRKKYVSTAFFTLCAISVLVFVLFAVLSNLVNLASVLNAPPAMAHELKILSYFVIGSFCIRLITSITSTLLTAEQEPAIPALIGLLGHLLSFCIVYILTKTTSHSILLFGIALSVSQVMPLFIAFIYLFSTRYKIVFPSISDFSKQHMSSIYSLGLRFFTIQVTALVLFQSNNIIIAHVCGLEDVTKFNIAYKYINILFMVFTQLSSPLWSASTEAFTVGDFAWIKNIMRHLNRIWLLIILGAILLVVFSPLVYRFWLKNTVVPNITLLALISFYFVFLARSFMYRNFMNGVGKIKLQFYITTLQSILHIPLAIFFGKYYGLTGIVIVMIIWSLMNAVWEQIQYSKIITLTANGLWNK